MPTNPIPQIYRAATPYIIVNGASRAIDFYKAAFSATELVRLADLSGKIMHAELRIWRAPLMLADEFPEMGYRSPESLGQCQAPCRRQSKRKTMMLSANGGFRLDVATTLDSGG